MLKFLTKIIWSLPIPLPRRGFQISVAGERGILYFDKSGTYKIDAKFIESGNSKRYEFDLGDVRTYNPSLDSDQWFGEVEKAKAKEILIRTKEHLHEKGISTD